MFEVTDIDRHGSYSWLDMWSDGRTQVVECDFCCMVSPPHFKKFILPSLEYEISCLDHAMYHLDGIGALVHLDDLLAIPHLHGIQWVQGAGEAPMPEWIDILRKIQQAGKSVHITVTIDELEAVHPDLAPEKVFYCVVGCQSESEAQGVIDWLQAHSKRAGRRS